MHRDQKIGLSLGVLLIGFAAAFCFRNQPIDELHPLAVEQTAALDSRIEQLPVRAYTQREGVDLHRQPDPLEAASDLVDVSFVDQPIQAISLEHSPASGDTVDLFAGPPEPMPAAPHQTLSAVHVIAPLQPATRTAVVSPPAPPQQASVGPTPAPADDNPQRFATATLNQPAQQAGRTYVVTSGDTLSGVSLQMYGTVSRYLEIYQANRDVLRDPDDLPVGTTLRIP